MKQRIYALLFVVIATLFLITPTQAQSQTDIIDRLNAKLGVRLSAEYEAKVKVFVANDTIMRTRSATAFTEQFIIEQFKNDWGINRQNQLLFMWSKIYGGISQKKLYNWLDDDNNERSGEYKKCLKNISEFYNGYKKGFKEYMDAGIAEAERQSAEAKRQIAEAERQSAEAINEIKEADSLGLKEGVKYYMLCIKNPQTNDKGEIEAVKKALKDIIATCKRDNIDYKAILRKELGDDKKVQELLKFYGVE